MESIRYSKEVSMVPCPCILMFNLKITIVESWWSQWYHFCTLRLRKSQRVKYDQETPSAFLWLLLIVNWWRRGSIVEFSVTCMFFCQTQTSSPLCFYEYELKIDFWATTGAPFPKDFREVVKTIFKRLFRVYAHIYHSHFQKIVSLKEEAHLNTCFKHFILFTNVLPPASDLYPYPAFNMQIYFSQDLCLSLDKGIWQL